MINEKPDSLRQLSDRVDRFCRDRDWGKFHNTKDLAISLALEAGEVLEITQWKDAKELASGTESVRRRLEAELSDVLYWLLLLSSHHGIDLASAFDRKMSENESKYPVELARGSKAKYTELSDRG